jgi:CBS domain containing-hemolysin-like protein
MAGLAVCLLASIFFSLTDSALTHFAHGALRQRVGDAARFERHLARRRAYQLTCFVLGAVADILFVVLLTQALLAEGHGPARTVATLGLAVLGVLLVGEVIPRAWGQARADRWLALVLPVLGGLTVLAWPLTAAVRGLTAAVGRLAGSPAVSDAPGERGEEICSVVSDREQCAALEAGEKEMIESIVDLHDVTAGEIMTPRTDMVCIEAGAPFEEVVALATQSGFSRIPVFEKTRDNILGVVYVKDLLRPPRPGQTARDVAKPPYFVPESKRVHELLHELSAEHCHLAIVLDEYGGTAGLITLEDILEEIVGEITDEYDRKLSERLRLVDLHTIECEGGLAIGDLNGALRLQLPQDQAVDTVGGFVTAQLGRIPAKGETFAWRNVQFTVLDATPRRVRRLRVAVQPEPPAAESA